MEDIVEKGEIAHFEQFHLFPQCFPKDFFFHCVRMSIYGGKGENIVAFLQLSDGFTTYSVK